MYEAIVMLWAGVLERDGHWVAANWARSQVQELAVELERTHDAVDFPAP